MTTSFVRRPLRVTTIGALGAGVALACGGDGGTGPEPMPTDDLLVAGVARADLSPVDPLGGFVVFFLDRAEERLRTATVTVSGVAIPLTIEPEPGRGPVYVSGASVTPGATYQLSAELTVDGATRRITSDAVSAPAEFPFAIPADHPANQPLEVTWGPIPDAERVTVTAGSGFETDVEVDRGQATIPASAFAGLAPGATLEVEITAYNGFFVSLTTGVNAFVDIPAFAARLAEIDNVDGALGAFGAATTRGALVTLQ